MRQIASRQTAQFLRVMLVGLLSDDGRSMLSILLLQISLRNNGTNLNVCEGDSLFRPPIKFICVANFHKSPIHFI